MRTWLLVLTLIASCADHSRSQKTVTLSVGIAEDRAMSLASDVKISGSLLRIQTPALDFSIPLGTETQQIEVPVGKIKAHIDVYALQCQGEMRFLRSQATVLQEIDPTTDTLVFNLAAWSAVPMRSARVYLTGQDGKPVEAIEAGLSDPNKNLNFGSCNGDKVFFKSDRDGIMSITVPELSEGTNLVFPWGAVLLKPGPEDAFTLSLGNPGSLVARVVHPSPTSVATLEPVVPAPGAQATAIPTTQPVVTPTGTATPTITPTATPYPTTSPTPTPTATPTPTFTCSVLADRTVQCSGKNDFGQLGDGTTVDSVTPVTVQGITTAVSVKAGARHACAYVDAGNAMINDQVVAISELWCWGANDKKQIASFSEPIYTTPLRVTSAQTAHFSRYSVQAESTCREFTNSVNFPLPEGGLVTYPTHVNCEGAGFLKNTTTSIIKNLNQFLQSGSSYIVGHGLNADGSIYSNDSSTFVWTGASN